MSAIRIKASDIPDDCEIEVWGDSTVWIFHPGTDVRLMFREWVERSRVRADVPFLMPHDQACGPGPWPS